MTLIAMEASPNKNFPGSYCITIKELETSGASVAVQRDGLSISLKSHCSSEVMESKVLMTHLKEILSSLTYMCMMQWMRGQKMIKTM